MIKTGIRDKEEGNLLRKPFQRLDYMLLKLSYQALSVNSFASFSGFFTIAVHVVSLT
jgi:hypothetical protein